MFGSRLARRLRCRRSLAVLVLVLIIVFVQLSSSMYRPQSTTVPSTPTTSSTDVLSDYTPSPRPATEVLEELEVKGRAAKTGYTRSQFSDGWADLGGCDVRNLILQRDMQATVIDQNGCKVQSGTLFDPYTAKSITFVRGDTTSDDVQIDHVVALSDAWQKGAQMIGSSARLQLANDALNLLAVDGDINQKKGDSDAASWLPPNKEYRCRYVARQIAVKKKYHLWVTDAEKASMKRVLDACPEQLLPVEKVGVVSFMLDHLLTGVGDGSLRDWTSIK